MRRIALSLLTVAMAAGAGAPALAQHQTGPTGSRVAFPIPAEIRSDGSKEDNSLIVMREFARCTYTRSPRQVATTVMLAPGEDGAALAKLAASQCLDSGRLGFSAALFRGALYGELYRRHEKRADRGWDLPVQPLALETPPAAGAPADARANYFMMTLAQCMYEAAPQQMKDIVLQPAASDAQKQAFGTIIQMLGPCVPQGLKLTLNRMALEHAFAEYLYRAQLAAGAN